MDKKPLIRKCLAVGIILLFVGVTIAPTINFTTVKASQQNIIKERINQRELLFQTICDIANNKEIQRVILKSQMSKGIFPASEFPVVTKTQIRQMYFLGLFLSKVISKSWIQSMIGKYQFSNQEMQKEISTVIEKDTIINSEITQLKNSECDCENKEGASWRFPVICATLYVLMLSLAFLALIVGIVTLPLLIFGIELFEPIIVYIIGPMIFVDWTIAHDLDCAWWGPLPGVVS